MTHSINHPWGISEKHRSRYGELWANLDFVFADKISNDLFKENKSMIEKTRMSTSIEQTSQIKRQD